MRNQSVAVDEKFVPLGFATEYLMVVEHQGSLAFACFALKDQRRSKTADPAAYNRAIVYLSSVDKVCRRALEFAIANAMTGLEDCGRVSVGIRIVAHASIASPIIGTWTTLCGVPSHQLYRRSRTQQRSSGGQKSRIQEISARNVLIQSESFVGIRTAQGFLRR